MAIEMYKGMNLTGTPSWHGTRDEYDNLAIHDPNTMYFIEDETGSCILWKGTREMFNNLPSEYKNDNTLYVITDESFSVDSEEVSYDNATSGLTSVNVQDAIDEVNTKVNTLPKPMQYKGTLGTGGTIQTLPAASDENNGYVYKVITDAIYALDSFYYKVVARAIGNYVVWDCTKAKDLSYTDIIKQEILEPRGGVGNLTFDNTLYIRRPNSTRIEALIDGILYNGVTYNTGETIFSTNSEYWTCSGISYGQQIHAKVGDMFISNGTEWTYIPSGDDASSFAALTDTNISNPSNGQMPVYDATSGLWKNEDYIKEVTYATWQTMTDEQKANGKYIVSDYPTVTTAPIIDNQTTASNVWSGQKINSELGNKVNTIDYSGNTLKTSVSKTGSGSTVTNSIAAETSMDDAIGTLLNNDYALSVNLTNTRFTRMNVSSGTTNEAVIDMSSMPMGCYEFRTVAAGGYETLPPQFVAWRGGQLVADYVNIHANSRIDGAILHLYTAGWYVTPYYRLNEAVISTPSTE